MKTMLTTLVGDDYFDGITKLHPEEGDVFLFHMKTDDMGVPIASVETMQEQMTVISHTLESAGIQTAIAAVTDKICLFSVADAEKIIRQLEEVIKYVQEAKEKLVDIENGNSEEDSVVVDAADATMRVL